MQNIFILPEYNIPNYLNKIIFFNSEENFN